jgi:hypothetical protein
MKTLQSRLLIILIALDHLALALLTLGHCVRGETISAALWSLELGGKWPGRLGRPLVDALFYPLQRQHCQQCWQSERHLYAAHQP